MTPRAAYFACVSSAADSTIRVSTLWRSRSDEIAVTASSRARAGPDRGAMRPVWTAAKPPACEWPGSPYGLEQVPRLLQAVARSSGFATAGARGVPSGREPAQDRRRHLHRPPGAEAASGELAPGDAQLEVARPRGPGPGLPGRADVLDVRGVRHDLGPAAGHDAPAVLIGVVEVVDLEGEHRVAAMGAEQAVRRRADHDRVVHH